MTAAHSIVQTGTQSDQKEVAMMPMNLRVGVHNHTFTVTVGADTSTDKSILSARFSIAETIAALTKNQRPIERIIIQSNGTDNETANLLMGLTNGLIAFQKINPNLLKIKELIIDSQVTDGMVIGDYDVWEEKEEAERKQAFRDFLTVMVTQSSLERIEFTATGTRIFSEGVGTFLTRDIATVLSYFLKEIPLRTLALDGVHVRSHLPLREVFASHKTLRTVSIGCSNHNMDSDPLIYELPEVLQSIYSNITLTSLTIGNMLISTPIDEHIPAKENPSMTKLNADNFCLSMRRKDMVKFFKAFPNLTELSFHDISSNNRDELKADDDYEDDASARDGYVELRQYLGANTKLTSISLGGLTLEKKGLEIVSPFLKDNSTLRSLVLEGLPFENFSSHERDEYYESKKNTGRFKALANSLSENKALTSLSLPKAHSFDLQRVYGDLFKDHVSLRILDISYAIEFGDTDYQAILFYLSINHSLTALNMYNTKQSWSDPCEEMFYRALSINKTLQVLIYNMHDWLRAQLVNTSLLYIGNEEAIEHADILKILQENQRKRKEREIFSITYKMLAVASAFSSSNKGHPFEHSVTPLLPAIAAFDIDEDVPAFNNIVRHEPAPISGETLLAINRACNKWTFFQALRVQVADSKLTAASGSSNSRTLGKRKLDG